MKQRRVGFIGVAVVGLVVLAGLSGCNTKFGASLFRLADPIVMDGSQLPKLVGADPTRVVAFAWDGSAWHQVPVQVDQRDLVNPGQIYNRPTSAYANLAGGGPYKILVYTPPPASPGYVNYPTYTPADSNPLVDANDQVSFLASDLGKQAATGDPVGVNPASRQEVKATDPLTPANTGYVYLYSSPTLTGGGAGTTGVSYTFSLDSGDYKTTYKMGTASLAPNNVAGPNPEHSVITTGTYQQTYADRWLNNGLVIKTANSSQADLLDRTIYPVPGTCGRSEDTYDDFVPSSPYEGAFIANISGPVRAIRSHIGANSFTYTAQTEIFYPDREDSVIDLRGHAGLPGYGSYDDFTTDLAGLTYSDNANSNIAIDGTPDAVTAINQTTPVSGAPIWQLVTGAAGSLVTTRTLATTIAGVRLSTYYKDQKPATPTPCTGDASAWGDNGFIALAPTGTSFTNTDPTQVVDPPTFVATRTRYPAGPGVTATFAAGLAAQAQNPITTAVS